MDQDEGRVFAVKPFQFFKINPLNVRHPEQPAKRECTSCCYCCRVVQQLIVVSLFAAVPRPRSGHRIICDDNHNVFSFGGFNPTQQELSDGTAEEEGWDTSKPLFRDLWKYDAVTRSWNKIRTQGDHPEQLASHAAAYFRDHLVVYGGTGVPFGQSSTNKVHACDLRNGVWHWLRPQNTDEMEMPTDQYGQAILVDNESNCLYAVGGTTGFRYTIDVYKFCLFTRRWSPLWKRHDSDQNQFPEERYRHEVVLHDNRIYVFGGGTAQTCFGFKHIPVFDLTTNSWVRLQSNPKRPKARVPLPRKCHGCVKSSTNQVYIMGGSDGTRIFHDIWKFDLNNSSWEKLSVEMPAPLYFHGITISPVGKVTIFGGVNRITNNQMDTNVRTNDLYEVWVQVPPLQELAWMSLVHFAECSSLTRCSRLELAEQGVPTKFLNRLTLQAPQVSAKSASVDKRPKWLPQAS